MVENFSRYSFSFCRGFAGRRSFGQRGLRDAVSGRFLCALNNLPLFVRTFLYAYSIRAVIISTVGLEWHFVSSHNTGTTLTPRYIPRIPHYKPITSILFWRRRLRYDPRAGCYQWLVVVTAVNWWLDVLMCSLVGVIQQYQNVDTSTKINVLMCWCASWWGGIQQY